MTDKFIAVANRQEANRAAKYLESLGYRLEGRGVSDNYKQTTLTLSTSEDIYYCSDVSTEHHLEQYEEEQLFVPADFEPAQEHKEDYVLSGVWQYYDNKYEAWEFPSHFAICERWYLLSRGYQIRDLYIKA